MSESVRTLIYAAVAAVITGLALLTNNSYTPSEDAEFAKIGKPFYPEFTNANAAMALEVYAYDEVQRELQSFRVVYEDGEWVIPSHYDYPAEAKERLHKAAASLMGIEREALAGRLKSAHERYGVIDPRLEDITQLEGHGQRVRLLGEKDTVLADYIIGKQVEGRSGIYYVRRPKEPETYMVQLDLDVSTKFADWIEPDLLKIQRDDIIHISQKVPIIKEVPIQPGLNVLQKVGENSVMLNRPKGGVSTEWQLPGLNEETEQLKQSAITQMLVALDGMELQGVRTKPPGLTPDLGIDFSWMGPGSTEQDFLRGRGLDLRDELSARGFQLVPISDPGRTGPIEFALLGDGGDFEVVSQEGLRYHLHFGKILSGGQKDIEIGNTGTAALESEDEDAADDATKGDDNSDESNKDETDGEKGQLARYLFVRVQFDESLIPDPPSRPEPPQPKALPGTPAAAQKPGKPLVDTREVSQEAKAAYDTELAQYQDDVIAHDKKIKAGRELAKQLNERFAPYYYLVSAESYQKLKLDRSELVEPKSDKPPASPTPGPGGRPNFNLPGGLNFPPGLGRPPGQ